MPKKIYLPACLFLTLAILTLSSGIYAQQIYFGKSVKGDYLGEAKPDTVPRLFAPGVVSTASYEHSSIMLSPDGNELYWTQLTAGHGSEALVKTMRRIKKKWTSPAKATFLGGYDDMYPVFSADGKKIYFTTGRAKESKDSIAKERGIWFVEKAKKGWSAPAYIGFDSLDIYGLSVAANHAVYFMARHTHSGSSYDLYVSRWINGKYATYEKLPEPLNTRHYEDGPYIAPDESYLLFESDRPGGFGGIDLYICYRKADGSWTIPQNLGPAINTASGERFAYVSPDGKYLFFGSDRRQNNYDVYWVDAKIIGPPATGTH